MTTPEATQTLAREQFGALLKLARRTLRYGRAAAVATVIGVAVTAAFVSVKPRFYQSETVLYYQEGFQWDTQPEGLRRAGQRLRDTVLARTRLQEIVKDLELFPKLVKTGKMEDAVEEMRRRITFRVNDGDTITLAFVGDSPQDAQLVTSTLAQSLIADNLRLRSEQIDLAKNFLDSQRRRNEEQLRLKETELARLLARHPELSSAVPGVPIRAPAPVPTVVPDAPPPPPSPRSEARAEAVAAERQAAAQLAAARRDYASQRERFTEQHPAVVTATANLKAAEAAHQRAVDALVALPPDPDRPRYTRSPGGTVVVQQPRIRVETLEEHARLTREVSELRERFQQLDARQFVATMAASSFQGGHSAQLSVIDPAYLPARPTGLRTSLLAALGVAASLALGVLAAVAFALMDDRLYDRRDVEAWGHARVLGEVTLLKEAEVAKAAAAARAAPAGGATVEVPASGAGADGPRLIAAGTPSAAAAAPASQALAVVRGPGTALAVSHGTGISVADLPPDPRLVLLHAPDSAAAATYRILRHRLAELGGPRCLLVTSADAGEGKTTCALNLALALSEAGRANVLLLDAHFRRPALGALIGRRFPGTPRRAPGPGETGPWAAIDHLTPWLQFSVLGEDHQPQLVDGLSMRLRLEELGAADYDYIVIDGPPILGSADANLLQESASAVLITAWARRSQARSLRKAIDQIGARKVLGVVLIGSPA